MVSYEQRFFERQKVEIESIRKMPARAADTGTVTHTMRRAAHPSECARCGAGAGCSAIKYQFLSRPFEENPQSKPQTLNPTGDSPGKVFLPCASILCPRQRLPSKSLQGDYKTRILVEHLQRPDTTIFSFTMPWYNNI